MRLDQLSVALRPRTPWEAMDLGQALVRRHAAALWKPWFALGGRYDFDRCWTLAAELLHVPLRVQREGNGRRETDPFTGVGLQLRYRFE